MLSVLNVTSQSRVIKRLQNVSGHPLILSHLLAKFNGWKHYYSEDILFLVVEERYFTC